MLSNTGLSRTQRALREQPYLTRTTSRSTRLLVAVPSHCSLVNFTRRQSFSILARTWISTRAHDYIFTVYFIPSTIEQVLQPLTVPLIPQVCAFHRVSTHLGPTDWHLARRSNWAPFPHAVDSPGPPRAIRGKGASCTEPHLGECGVQNLCENLHFPTHSLVPQQASSPCVESKQHHPMKTPSQTPHAKQQGASKSFLNFHQGPRSWRVPLVSQRPQSCLDPCFLQKSSV